LQLFLASSLDSNGAGHGGDVPPNMAYANGGEPLLPRAPELDMPQRGASLVESHDHSLGIDKFLLLLNQ